MNITTPGKVLQLTELWDGPHNCSSKLTWENLDLSAIVGSGTKYVQVFVIVNTDATGYACTAGCRVDGSALARTWNMGSTASPTRAMELIVKVSQARILEIYANVSAAGSVALVDFYIGGYWS